jgi:8-oxo-dGTP diphosphatase
MAYNDFFRLSSHAIITNPEGKVLLLKATYCEKQWGLPGGALEPEETIHEALIRECQEELGLDVKVCYMSGMYFHKAYNSHTCIFKCEIPENSKIILSSEHSEYKYFSLDEMSSNHRHRVLDCLHFDGKVKSSKF